jgi:hypothetical protein
MVTEEVSRILQEIKKDKSLEAYFFEKLRITNDPFRWLDILKERNYFDPQNNPLSEKVNDKEELYTTPYWNILGYLGNLAKHIKDNPEERIIITFLDIVNSIINYRDSNGKRIENYLTDWVILKAIFNLPIEYITTNHVRFIKVALLTNPTLVSSEIIKTILPYLISEKAKSLMLELLKIILDYKRGRTPFFSGYVSILDNYWLNELLQKYKEKIFEICGLGGAYTAISKIESIINENATEYSIGAVVTIEDSSQNFSEDSYAIQMVFFVRDSLEHTCIEDVRLMVENLIEKRHPIFKRLALHAINCHYDDLNDIFWKKGMDALEETETWHELFELFRINCNKFTESQLNHIISWIETHEYKLPKDVFKDPQQAERVLADRRKWWLLALLDSKNEKVMNLFEKYNKINPNEVDHPGYLIWHSAVFIGPESKPLEYEPESNWEVAKSLRIQKDESFRISVRRNAIRYSKDMSSFLNISREMQHALLSGLYDAWESGDHFEWDELFDFILKIIEDETFWKERYETDNYRDWIVRKVADLIQIGTKDDSRSFEKHLLPLAEKVLLILAQKDNSTFSQGSDLVTAVLNSSKGAIFSAMIIYSLRYARFEKKRSWSIPIKRYFDECLNQSSSPIEMYVTLGLYLYNISYLDSSWIRQNIHRIFPKNHEECWKATFTGYLFTSARIYKEIYGLLRDNNHYLQALNTIFDNEYATQRLVEHIVIGYLYDWEELNDE